MQEGLSSRDKTRRARDAPTRSKDDFSLEAKRKKERKKIISFYHRASLERPRISTRADSKKIRNDTQEGVHKM